MPQPEVAAMASWMDTLKLPIRQIESTYTLSELFILSWNSRLQSYNMSQRFQSARTPALTDGSDKVTIIDSSYSGNSGNPNGVRDLGNAWAFPDSINKGVPIPKKFFDEEGNMDLRRASGPEAVAYLQKIGVNLMVPMHL